MKKFLVLFLLVFTTCVYAQNVTIDGYDYQKADVLEFHAMPEPSTSITNRTRVYMDSTSGKLMCSEDGGAYVECVGGGGSGSGDITDVYDCSSGNCYSIVLSEGDLLDMSPVSIDSGTEGFILPQGDDCSLSTREGQVCWDNSSDVLFIGTGTVASGLLSGTGSGTGDGDMLKSVYDTNDDGVVDDSEMAQALAANGGNCPAGYYSRGIDEAGWAEDCTAIPIYGGTNDSPWTSLGGNVFLLYPTYDTVVGSTTPVDSSKLSIDGDDDQVQMIIKGHSTQTNDIFQIQNDGSTNLLTVDNAGTVEIGTGTNGAIFIAERSAADSSAAGYGQFWVLNSAPNKPYFTDDTGVSYDLTTGSGTSDSPWTSLTGNVFLDTTTDEVIIGGASPLSSAKLSVDGDADQIQTIIQANATQTSDVVVVEQSDGTDIFTVDNAGAVDVGSTLSFLSGGSSYGGLKWQAVGNDSLVIFTDVGNALYSGYVSLMEKSDVENANRAPSGTSANPVFRVYSSDATSATDYIEMYHDQTNANILSVDSLMLLSSNNINLNTDNFIDLDSGYGYFRFQKSGETDFQISVDSTRDQVILAPDDNGGNQIIITNRAFSGDDHDHNTTTNPTLFIHSDTDPDSDNTQWMSLAHDKTDGVITTGAGALRLVAGSGKLDINDTAVDDDDCTGEQGKYWYDSTDSAFEFCNANSGTPDVLGGGGGTPGGSTTQIQYNLGGAFAGTPSWTTNGRDIGAVGTLNISTGANIIPQTTDCSGRVKEGELCWDTDGNVLFVGTGSVASGINGGSASNPGGGDTHVQINKDGTFYGDEALKVNFSTDTLYVGTGTNGSIRFGTNTLTDAKLDNVLLDYYNLDNDDALLTGWGITAGATLSGGKLLFDDTTDEQAVWKFRMPETYQTGLRGYIQYATASAIANEIDFELYVNCYQPNTDHLDIDNIVWGTPNTQYDTVPGTAGWPDEVVISLTNHAGGSGGCQPGDLVVIMLSTDADDATYDDATGDREILSTQIDWQR